MSDSSGPNGNTLVDRLLAGLNAHDGNAIGELMSEDVEYIHWQRDAWVTVTGRPEVVALLDSFDKELSSDFTVQAMFVVVSADGFAIEYNEAGTNDRGVDQSGRRFTLRNVMVGVFRAGKISRLTDYSDVTAYRSQTSRA